MLTIQTANSIADLEGILSLQRENLAAQLSDPERSSQGFVTVQHLISDLRAFAALAPQVIAKEGEKVCGYLLAMHKSLRNTVPVLIPMFEQFDRIQFHGRTISDFNYLTVGQVCVKKEYREKGILDEMYNRYRTLFCEHYDFAITEIAASNIRSLKAHARVGFQVVHSFRDAYEEWNIVVWDWNKIF